MTAMEQWLLETSREILKSDQEAQRTVITTLEQRVACALLQARAKECRHQAGEIELKNPGNSTLRAMAAYLRERSHKLEEMAMAMVGNWPPKEVRLEVVQ